MDAQKRSYKKVNLRNLKSSCETSYPMCPGLIHFWTQSHLMMYVSLWYCFAQANTQLLSLALSDVVNEIASRISILICCPKIHSMSFFQFMDCWIREYVLLQEQN